ncbi:MAG: outer membrane protein assembly factor BamD [Ignavibacteriae bacterium]|nr:outer membrane protein assembly factor BamD [Ignavibacteriota bacterium]
MSRTLPIVAAAVLAVCCAACSSTTPADIPTAEQRFRLGMAEYADEDYFDAIQHFEVIRLQYPTSPVADSARFFMGMSRFNREEYILASYEFSQIGQVSSSPALQTEAQYMYARCYVELSPKAALDQTYTMRAIDALQTFIETNPKHPKAADAEKDMLGLINRLAEKEYRTGLLYMKLENARAAEVYFDTVIDKYYSTEYVDDAAAMKIRALISRKQYAAAGDRITQFLEKYPTSPLRDDVAALRADLPAETRSNARPK